MNLFTTKAVQDRLASPMGTIDLETVELIHERETNQESYVALTHKMAGDMKNLASVSVRRFKEFLPQLLPYFTQDAYFSVNGFGCASPRVNGTTGLPDVWRKEARLRYLNACYLDVDSYKAGVEWEQAVAILLRASEAKIIPAPSIIGRSGRGVYLLWLLHNGVDGGSERAFSNKIALYKKVHQAIQARLVAYDSLFSSCGVIDPIRDASRVLRLGGSLNSKAGSVVKYIVLGTENGMAPFYTLKEVAKFCGVREYNHSKLSQDFYTNSFENGRAVKHPGTCPARRNGQITIARRRLEDMEAIEQRIGGFKEGIRRRTLTLFAQFAKRAGYAYTTTLDQAELIASRCNPPFPSHEDDSTVKAIVAGVWNEARGRYPKNSTLARFLGVTAEMADDLELQSIVPEETRTRRKTTPSRRGQTQRARREAMSEILTRHPASYPSLRDMKKQLQDMGIEASHETIRRELPSILRNSGKPKIP